MSSNDVQTGSPDPHGSWRIQKRILVLRKCFQLSLVIYSVLFQRGNLTYLLCGDGGLCQALEQVRIRNFTHFLSAVCTGLPNSSTFRIPSTKEFVERSVRWNSLLGKPSILDGLFIWSSGIKILPLYPPIMSEPLFHSDFTTFLQQDLLSVYHLVWLQRNTNLAAYPTPWELYCIMF